MSPKSLNRRNFLGVLATGLCAAPWLRAEVSSARVATFVCDITPPLGTPIYSSLKPLTVVEHPLLAKGIIIEDDGGRSVLCALDYCILCNSVHDLYRQRIAEAAGTSIDQVAVQTVHQHTAPVVDCDATRLLEQEMDISHFPSIASFEDPASDIAAAVREALNQLQPFDRIGMSQARVHQVASNRRVPIGEGKVGFRASSCKDPDFIAKPEGLIDPFLKTVTFSKGDKALAQLHYYATHPQSFYGDSRASYDFVGMARERLQQEEQVFQLYFTGCSGDVAAGKYNDASPEAREGLYERLYAAMKESVAAVAYEPAQKALWRSTQLSFKLRNDERYNMARSAQALKDPNKTPLEHLTEAMFLSWAHRIEKPLDLTMMRLGNVVFVHLPGEPMVEFQHYAQALLPDAFVVVAAYGDGGPAYICPDRVYAEGGYEAGASHTAPGADQQLREAIKTLMTG
ncbi:MAG: hypothetical protein WCX86_07660 [Candidatus Hydrogenedentales bacterium]|jgi:hypothetical protein